MAALGASRLVESAVSSSNISSAGLSRYPVLSYTASNIRENGLRNIVPPLSVLLLLHGDACHPGEGRYCRIELGFPTSHEQPPSRVVGLP